MSTTTTMTLTEFDTWAAGRDETWELVEGVPRMVPHESIGNLDVAMALRDVILKTLPGSTYRVLPQAGVTLSDTAAPRVRVPDLVIADRTSQAAVRFDAKDVLLVVEVLSPSTAHVDLVEKRRDYAAADIPAYLIIDTRPDVPVLTLHDEVGTTTGEQVTLHLDGHAIEVRGSDLIR